MSASQTAASADNASHATTADNVGGVSATKVFFKANRDTGPTTTLNMGGPSARATCDGTGHTDVTVKTSVDNRKFS